MKSVPPSNPEQEAERGSASPSAPPDDELSQWMRRAFKQHDVGPDVDVLEGVQQRLRERSGGKFYKDGWSTTRHAPFATYFITTLLMAVAVVLVYAILTPIIADPVPITRPVHIIPRAEHTPR
jgi:hypothetical protein